ncbi:Conserved_hypothetical protein [Hexamita inflata]|uniref:CCDC113/CCDC96 coiled-coil domain-containing protein n=3 Tax=Hexamita inflata TaxID=28002 RepID=A0AA86PV91_9EUKA|nr:Conserved hypothetical protein [Hexamita inflata]
MSYFQSFVEDRNGSPLAMEQQGLFIQEGRLEQERLIQDNQDLQMRASRLLSIEDVERALKPYRDHQGRSGAEIQIKYHQTLSDIDQTRVDIAALETKADQEKMVLKTSFEEVQNQCDELQLQFQLIREAASQLQVPAFGVQLTAQKVLDLESAFKQQLQHSEDARLSQITAVEMLKNVEQKQKRQSEIADKLQQIDYEQLKIANQSLAEKIEERSEELLKLRRRTVSTLQILAHVREKKHFVENQVGELMRQQTGFDDSINKLRTELGDLKVQKNRCRQLADQSRDQTGLSGNPVLKNDYDRRQVVVEQLHQTMAELKEHYGRLVGHFDNLQSKMK